MVNSNHISNQLSTRVVTSSEDFANVLLVRAMCFMQNGLPRHEAIDGNDFQSTHFLVLHGDEPIGSGRVRWFSDFAKIERTGFREGYRHPRIIKMIAEAMFEHAARKGYTKVITHAEVKYARLWEKLLGFEVINDGKPLAYPNVKEELLELVKHLEPQKDAITANTDGIVMSRIEGAWDEAHAAEF